MDCYYEQCWQMVFDVVPDSELNDMQIQLDALLFEKVPYELVDKDGVSK